KHKIGHMALTRDGAARSPNFAPKPFYGPAFSGSIASVGSGRRGDQMNDGAQPDIEPTSPNDRISPHCSDKLGRNPAAQQSPPVLRCDILSVGSTGSTGSETARVHRTPRECGRVAARGARCRAKAGPDRICIFWFAIQRV